MTEETTKRSSGTDEIDLVEFIKKIWAQRKTIYKSVAIFFVLGLIIIIASPREYKSEVTLLVESSSSTSGMSGLLQQFGGLAGLSGLGSMTSEEALTPELYPDIIKSTPFLLEILDTKITDSKYDSTLMVAEFFERHTHKSLSKILREYSIGLPGKIFGLIRRKSKTQNFVTKTDNGPLRLTPRESWLTGELSKRIKAIEGESLNTLKVEVEMQDPRLAAQLADSVVKSLTRYIIEYRTQKARVDLQFIELSHREAEKKYFRAQQALAAFKDRNLNIITSSGKITEQNLQADYTLALNIYTTLSQQLEQAKLKVQEKTPVFKVMEPAKIPLSNDKPKSIIILIAAIFLGGLISFGIIIFKNIKFR